MHDGLSLPIICAANPQLFAKWFVHLKILMTHPILKDEEKLLWIWLATSCANNPTLTCSLSYEQIATAVDKPVRDIHRILFRLKIMGILMGDIPIWYGPPTAQMIIEVRHIRLMLLDRVQMEVGLDAKVHREEERGVVFNA